MCDDPKCRSVPFATPTAAELSFRWCNKVNYFDDNETYAPISMVHSLNPGKEALLKYYIHAIGFLPSQVRGRFLTTNSVRGPFCRQVTSDTWKPQLNCQQYFIYCKILFIFHNSMISINKLHAPPGQYFSHLFHNVILSEF